MGASWRDGAAWYCEEADREQSGLEIPGVWSRSQRPAQSPLPSPILPNMSLYSASPPLKLFIENEGTER